MRRALQATTGTVLLSPAIKALKTRETLDETTLTAIAATTMTSRSEWNTRHAVSYRQGNWPRDPRDVESSSSSYERQTCYELTEQHGTSESTALTTEWTPTPSNCSRPSKSRYPDTADSVASTFLYRENYVYVCRRYWMHGKGENSKFEFIRTSLRIRGTVADNVYIYENAERPSVDWVYVNSPYV